VVLVTVEDFYSGPVKECVYKIFFYLSVLTSFIRSTNNFSISLKMHVAV